VKLKFILFSFVLLVGLLAFLPLQISEVKSQTSQPFSLVASVGKNATLEVTADYYRISNDLIGAEISRTNPPQVRYYDKLFNKTLIYMEQIFLERFNPINKQWNQIANQAYKYVSTFWLMVKQYC
jgi:hypothetical protein